LDAHTVSHTGPYCYTDIRAYGCPHFNEHLYLDAHAVGHTGPYRNSWWAYSYPHCNYYTHPHCNYYTHLHFYPCSHAICGVGCGVCRLVLFTRLSLLPRGDD
jgi:hypothetical protein